MASIRVLVVDDHAVVRKSVCSLLSREPTLDVICQAADGDKAVEKANELTPDLVLLDISLPGLSGIGAASQIRKVSPTSKIIFLSQHDSLHMAGSNESDLLTLAAAIETNSEHPLAKAIVAEAKRRNLPTLEAADFEALPGRGHRHA